MRVADAHCDTLTAYADNPFFSDVAHWNLPKFKAEGGTLQYFAIFTPEEYSGDSAFYYAGRHIGLFNRNKPAGVVLLENSDEYDENSVNILLSLEGAAPIVNKIENLYAFRKMGIRAMTLSWNHRNFLCDGVDNNYGLTGFGKEAVIEMEKIGIIVDVSHLNVAGFEDVASISSKPFIASHSNSDSVRRHRRNLTDWQIKEIISRGGFIGINLYTDFLAVDPKDSTGAITKHIDYILSLGGEDVLGMGADFDGIESCPFPDVSGYSKIAMLLKEEMKLDDILIDKIMYSNLKNYTLKMI